MKKSRFKVKVANFTTNVNGTVVHDKMKAYNECNKTLKQQIERNNNQNNKLKRKNDKTDTGVAVEYVLSKRMDNSRKKNINNENSEQSRKNLIINSDSSGNDDGSKDDTTPIMQLLKKSKHNQEQCNDDNTPLSKLFNEKKKSPKKQLFNDSKKRNHKEIDEDDTIHFKKKKAKKKEINDDETTPIVKLVKDSKKIKIDEVKDKIPITELMNLSKKKKKKDDTQKTTTKKIIKQKCYQKKKNKDNLDLEEDEADYNWEIPRDWTLKYYRRNTIMKSKRPSLKVIALENYRKQVAREGELLIHWEDGRREWAYCCNARTDAKAPMYNAALKRFKLTNVIMKLGLSKEIIIAINKQKDKLDYYSSDYAGKGKYKVSIVLQ